MVKKTPVDKSLFYYGELYNRLIDPLIKPARATIIEQIPSSSTVLDIGCGTGLLSIGLKRAKDCRVTGIDLSRRMLDFAISINPYQEVEFLHRDATDMADFADARFDFALILNVIHELWPEDQTEMVREASRVGKNVLLFDAYAPLPMNFSGVIKRLIEASFGYDHNPQFKQYLKEGGILGLLERAGYSSRISKQSIYSQGCNHLVLLSSMN